MQNVSEMLNVSSEGHHIKIPIYPSTSQKVIGNKIFRSLFFFFFRRHQCSGLSAFTISTAKYFTKQEPRGRLRVVAGLRLACERGGTFPMACAIPWARARSSHACYDRCRAQQPALIEITSPFQPHPPSGERKIR